MTKTDFIREVADDCGLTQKVASTALTSILAVIKETVSKGDEVSFLEFGKFYKKDLEERKGRNPQTGEEITIPAHSVFAFKASEKTRELFK